MEHVNRGCHTTIRHAEKHDVTFENNNKETSLDKNSAVDFQFISSVFLTAKGSEERSSELGVLEFRDINSSNSYHLHLPTIHKPSANEELTQMESLWRFKSVENSFVAVLEQFLKTVDLMDNTVLIPMKLIDLPVKDLMPASAPDSYLQNNMNMRAFYFMVKALGIKLSLGHGASSENEANNVPLEREIQDSCHRLNQLALLARYIRNSTQNLSPNHVLPSFQDFKREAMFHSEDSLLGSLKRFADEVESLEKAVLFPCLLRDHSVSEQMPQFDEGIKTLYDVFILLKKLRTELLSGSRNFELPDPKLQQKLSELIQTFLEYTAMTRNLTARYEEEVRCA